MKGFIVSAVLAAALAPAGVHAYQEVNPYLPHNTMPPAISGTVNLVNDHSVTLVSNEGETISFDVDSRSVMPPRLEVGQFVRVEFHLMESGRYLAKRVTPGQPGEGAQPTSYRDATLDHTNATATSTTGSDGSTTTTQTTTTGGGDGNVATTTDQTAADQGTAATAAAGEPDGGDGSLPATATPRPLLEVLGVLALAAGTVMWIARRRRRAV